MELVASKWGETKTFMLPCVEYGATDFLSGVTLAIGDVQVSKDGGAFANIATLPTILGKWMIVTLSAAEMQAGYITLQIIDQDATKIFEDNGAILTTNLESWYLALFSLIESQRGSHTGVHDAIYWDPIGGNDANSGFGFHDAKLTYSFNAPSGVHSLLNSNEHQIIFALPNASGSPTTVNEYIEIDKPYTFLRGPGRDFLIEATHVEASAIKSSAEGVEFSGFRVKTQALGSQAGIITTGDFTKISNVWVDYSRGSGIKIDNASSCILSDFLVQDAALGGSGHAVHILGDTTDANRNIIGSGKIFSNGNGGDTDGIRIDGANCLHNFVTGGDTGIYIHDNSGYGINEVNGADGTIIVGPTVHIGHNTLGDILLTGAESTEENWQQWAKHTDMQTALDGIAAIPTNPVTVASGSGTATVGYAQQSTTVTIVQGDKINVPFEITGDYSSKRLFYGAKANLSDTTYAMGDNAGGAGEIEIIGHTYDALTDLTIGLIPLTAAHTAVSAVVYQSEIEARDADGLSNPITPIRFKLDVAGEVITAD
ncbi:MAG: hypothetical protein KAV87_63330 [Desulfobacteraceae bacterium]|nr:hypothetical protein [Desulfobacteraceae bacterium]